MIKSRARELEGELRECEARSEECIRELQRQKSLYAEQVNKNSILYDELNRLESETTKIRVEIDNTRSSLVHFEDKKANSYSMNKDLLSIIEELKRAIEELTTQNKEVPFFSKIKKDFEGIGDNCRSG